MSEENIRYLDGKIELRRIKNALVRMIETKACDGAPLDDKTIEDLKQDLEEIMRRETN